MQKPDHILNQLATVVKSPQILEWREIEPSRQQQIVRAMRATGASSGPINPVSSLPVAIAYPHTQEELGELMTCAHAHGWRVLPCGRGSKLHWGGLAQPIDLVISTERLTQIIDHAVGDLTVTVEAGVAYRELQQFLLPTRQSLGIDPSYPDCATLGGIVATADTGFLRQHYGGVRDRVIGIAVVRTDGPITKAGGRVVKNVAGYDLMKLFTGSWGTLGIISQLTLRLYPLPPEAKTVWLTGSADSLQTVAAQLLASSLTPTAFTILLPTTVASLDLNGWPNQTHALTLIARFQSIATSINQQADQLIQWGQVNKLAGAMLEGDDEAHLWQQLSAQRSQPANADMITCKLGVLPTRIGPLLADLTRDYPAFHGWINGGSGLGWLYGNAADLSVAMVEQVRSRCQADGGFLSILAAPPDWKQSMDVWGYQGNALPIMTHLKRQFDPQHHLSPGRFIQGI